MEKKVYMVAGLALLIVALASFGVHARGMTGKSQSLSCHRTDLVGAIVKNSRGDVSGIVNRVEDDGGQSFAIINHGSDSYGEEGRYTPVPVGALEIAKSSKEQSNHLKTVVLSKTEKQMEAAPFWELTKMNDPKYLAKIDKFFRVQPLLCG